MTPLMIGPPMSVGRLWYLIEDTEAPPEEQAFWLEFYVGLALIAEREELQYR